MVRSSVSLLVTSHSSPGSASVVVSLPVTSESSALSILTPGSPAPARAPPLAPGRCPGPSLLQSSLTRPHPGPGTNRFLGATGAGGQSMDQVSDILGAAPILWNGRNYQSMYFSDNGTDIPCVLAPSATGFLSVFLPDLGSGQ